MRAIDVYFKQSFWTFELLVLLVAGVLAARLFNAVMASLLSSPTPAGGVPPAVDPPRASAVPTLAFLERNVFGAEREGCAAAPFHDCPCDRTPGACDATCGCDPFCAEGCRRREMHGELTATVVAEDPTLSVAIFQDATRKSPVAHYVDDAFEGGRIIAIEWRQVRVDRGGYCELLSLGDADLDAGAGPEPNHGARPLEGVTGLKEGDYDIARSVLEGVLGDLSTLAGSVRIVPSGGDGFRIFAIRPGSLPDAIGLQNADVIQRINGHALSSSASTIAMFAELKDATAITIDLIRGGRARTMRYTIR